MQTQFNVEKYTKLRIINLIFLISFFVIFVTTLCILDVGICCALALEEEIPQVSNGSNILKDIGWANYDENVLSISTETESPISGNGSLKVDVSPAISTAEAVNASWSIVSTDFIQANGNQYYNYSLQVSSKDVNQLHSKVIYYDSNKNEIKSDFIFGGRDGTFDKKYSNSFLAPNGTKYVQIQLWVRPTLEKSANYIVDDVKFSMAKF